MKDYFISEIFGPTVAGEGNIIGKRTMFVRFSGCDGYDGKRNWCLWCDSMHAVDPVNKPMWQKLDGRQIIDRLKSLAPYCFNVSLSGGNPALYDLEELVQDLHNAGYILNIETQGTIFRDWLSAIDNITVSPKPPSAGGDPDQVVHDFDYFYKLLIDKCHSDVLDYYPTFCIKVVVDPYSEADLNFARRIFRAVHSTPYEGEADLCVSKLTMPDDDLVKQFRQHRYLAEKIATDKTFYDVRVLSQLHVALWGHRLGV